MGDKKCNSDIKVKVKTFVCPDSKLVIMQLSVDFQSYWRQEAKTNSLEQNIGQFHKMHLDLKLTRIRKKRSEKWLTDVAEMLKGLNKSLDGE